MVCEKLVSFGYDVQRIGGGIVGVLKNGEGKTVLYRADYEINYRFKIGIKGGINMRILELTEETKGNILENLFQNK